MHSQTKIRPAGGRNSGAPLRPLMLHDLSNRAFFANAASRRRLRAASPASGPANHARHHAPLGAQA